MIHNDVLNQLHLLVKTSAPSLVEVAESPAELPQWTPGQKLPAHVLASLPNGRFQVSVGDQVLDMNLPKNTQPGDNIELAFVANQPRLTFVLSRETQLSSKTAAANSAALAGRDDSRLLSAADNGRAPVTLSDTARFLGTLLQKVAERQSDPQTQSLIKTEPLVPSPPADSREFAQMLRGALSQSGLFYESHQAQWVAGELSLNELLKEPQGKLSTTNMDTPAATMLHKDIGQQPAAQPAIQAGLQGPLPNDEPVKAQVMVSLAPEAGMPKPTDMVHPDTMPLIQQQLQTLDTRQMVWQGQVWPGQSMDWIVEEREAREGESAAVEIPQWQTKLRLHLPRLGTVAASLAFTREGLRINLAAAEPQTAENLKLAQTRLVNSLDAAGLKLLGVSVERNEHA